jgi:hypothetical protein
MKKYKSQSKVVEVTSNSKEEMTFVWIPSKNSASANFKFIFKVLTYSLIEEDKFLVHREIQCTFYAVYPRITYPNSH